MAEPKEKPKLTPQTVRSLTLSRYYLTLAKEHGRSDREADAFVTINLLHEAIETFLVASAEHLNVPVKARMEFVTYFDKLDEALAPQRLPFRTMLKRINKARVNAKHDGIVPDRAELPTFVASAESFLDEASQLVFQISLSSVSLVDLLNDGPMKQHLRSAQNALEDGREREVLIECRKALYLAFEKPFDVSAFADANAPKNALAWLVCRAPAHAQSKSYVDEKVCEPFDFIALDHAAVDRELVKDGLDPLIFWNLWRLTPQVFQTASGEWLVKHDLNKLEADAVKANASYVLENTINLLHQLERKRRAIRTTNHERWQAGVKIKAAKVYKKASRNSEVVATVPDDLKQLPVESGTPALDGEGYFWRVFHLPDFEAGNWIMGYVHEDDLSFD